MVDKGISLYPGMGYSLEECWSYLAAARRAGFSRLFTSLHIPEADASRLLTEFRQLAGQAARLGFSITADISPRAIAALGVAGDDLSALRELGLSALRLDFGFSGSDISDWVHRSGLKIEINASTVDEAALAAILNAGVAPQRLEACHNYYPRPETGLSYELFAQRCQMFRRCAIPVAAFVPSRRNPRGPLYAGLPTLEAHRSMSALQAAKELMWSGDVDAVLIGDPLAASAELTAIGSIPEDCVELQVTLKRELSDVERAILLADHANRTDPGAGVVRSAIARSLTAAEVPVAGNTPRPRGSVTIDNLLYQRYMGELQLVRQDLPADEKVNVVAQIIPGELFLLDYIIPGKKFRLVEVQ